MPTLERIFVVFDDHGREEEFELTRVVDDLTSLVHLLVTGQVQSRSAIRSNRRPDAHSRISRSSAAVRFAHSTTRRPHATRRLRRATRAKPQTSRAFRATVGHSERPLVGGLR